MRNPSWNGTAPILHASLTAEYAVNGSNASDTDDTGELSVQQKQHGHRVRDFILYIVIAVGVAALAFFLGVQNAKAGRAPEASKWVGFAFMTLLVFSWSIRAHRHLWRIAKFWRRIAFLAAVHVVVGIAILNRVAELPLLPFFLLAPVEYFLLNAILRNRFRDS